MFVNGINVNPLTGRADIDINAAVPVAGVSSRAALLYDNTPVPDTLQTDDGGIGPFFGNSGLLVDKDGLLEVTQVLPSGDPLYVNGLRVSQFGAVVVSTIGAIFTHVRGWPVTVNGELCIDP